jgi:hypothetical protein
MRKHSIVSARGGAWQRSAVRRANRKCKTNPTAKTTGAKDRHFLIA